jgi:hypothetical protein
MFEQPTLLRSTVSLCPQCGSEAIEAVSTGSSPEVLRDHPGVIEAQIVEADGQVYIKKHCDRHGSFEEPASLRCGFFTDAWRGFRSSPTVNTDRTRPFTLTAS